MDGKDGAQTRSGHLHEGSAPSSHSGGNDSVRETQTKSGYRDTAGAVAKRDTAGTVIEGQEERGYTGSGSDSAPVERANDGVDKPLSSAM
jgi:hypothetical protein